MRLPNYSVPGILNIVKHRIPLSQNEVVFRYVLILLGEVAAIALIKRIIIRRRVHILLLLLLLGLKELKFRTKVFIVIL